jgi:flagellar FliL protein
MADEGAAGTMSMNKTSLVPAIAGGVAVLTLLGGSAGWFVGMMVSPKIATIEKEQKVPQKAEAKKPEEGKKEEGSLPNVATAANGIVQLEPIVTNLSYPSENWLRLEVALMFNGPPDAQIAQDVHQDILAYVRTVSLQQIEGPRGFQYLRDDIQERVGLRSAGRVTKVIFRTFVIE